MNCSRTKPEEVYSTCRRLVSSRDWSTLMEESRENTVWQDIPKIISSKGQEMGFPEYLHDLSRLEAALQACLDMQEDMPAQPEQKMLNPSLLILELQWQGLTGLVDSSGKKDLSPVHGPETVLVWLDPLKNLARAQPADERILLALKIVAENLHMGNTALEHKIPVGGGGGLVLAPESGLKRNPAIFIPLEKTFERFLQPRVFTLQWHITQACDLNCKHCYDRTSRREMSFDSALQVLDHLEEFCRTKKVRAKVTFTGGNPLLYSHFDQLYLETVKRGFPVNILGNPASRQRLERLLEIQTPSMYQVSLEGLREYNDFVRQQGYFDKVMNFLPLLRELGIPSQVMLTLTRDNMDQVLPLGELLRDRADTFTFNRLSAVGQGADLLMPAPEDYRSFLKEYIQETANNPVLGLKDNLINIIRDENEDKPFGGCTGFGCGAGFNFATLLCDGEVHACRKFPSYMGNIFNEGLLNSYDSKAGIRYRDGSAACRQCKLLPACGGCQAVIFSLGLDPSLDRDPYCFYSLAP